MPKSSAPLPLLLQQTTICTSIEHSHGPTRASLILGHMRILLIMYCGCWDADPYRVANSQALNCQAQSLPPPLSRRPRPLPPFPTELCS